MADIGLSAAELADIRADVEDLLPDTCEIQEMTITVNSIGEAEKSYATREGASAVDCRLDPITPDLGWEVLGGFMDIVKYVGKWVLTLPHDTTIALDDRIILRSDTYEVDHISDNKSWQASVRCILEKVRP